MRKPETKIEAVKAVQYMLRSQFLGLPFHAAYPIAAATGGTTTKSVRKRTATSIQMRKGIVASLPFSLEAL
jgi:hypothetical protein